MMSITSIRQLKTKIETVIELLKEIEPGTSPTSIFKYGIEISKRNQKEAELMINSFKDHLPKEVQFYELDGKVIFQIQLQSGKVSNYCIFYLITRPKK